MLKCQVFGGSTFAGSLADPPRSVGISRITLAESALVCVQAGFLRYVDHMLNPGLDHLLERDEAAAATASRLLVQIVKVPSFLQIKGESVQRVVLQQPPNTQPLETRMAQPFMVFLRSH